MLYTLALCESVAVSVSLGKIISSKAVRYLLSYCF